MSLGSGRQTATLKQSICITDKNAIALAILGKVKSIGVSNFSEAKLEEILPTAKVIPAVDQVSEGPESDQGGGSH